MILSSCSCSCADKLRPEDLGLSTNLPFFTNADPNGLPPITYLHLYACSNFSVSYILLFSLFDSKQWLQSIIPPNCLLDLCRLVSFASQRELSFHYITTLAWLFLAKFFLAPCTSSHMIGSPVLRAPMRKSKHLQVCDLCNKFILCKRTRLDASFKHDFFFTH